MRGLRIVTALALWAGLAGCTSVYSVEAVGLKPLKIDAEQWQGEWVGADVKATVQVLDAEEGRIRFSLIARDAKPGKEPDTVEVELREGKDAFYASYVSKEKDGKDRYLWGRLKKDKRQVVIWMPDKKKIKDLIKDGELPGTAGFKDVTVGLLGKDHYKILESEEQGVLFMWEHPLVLMRAP